MQLFRQARDRISEHVRHWLAEQGVFVNQLTGELGQLGVAAAFGLVVTVAAVGHISGAHLKPAVTLTFA
jgi:glycerol uptake facilitator-like aquaporin